MRNQYEEMRDQASDKADAARRLMETPAFAEAFQRLEASYTEAWRTSPEHKSEERERLYYKLACLRELRADLENQIAGSRVVELNHRSSIKR